MLDALNKLPELKDVATDLQVKGLQIDVDARPRHGLASLGIQPQNIDDVLYDAFGQRQVATTYTQTNQYRVVLEMKPDLAANPDAIEQALRALRERRRRCPCACSPRSRPRRPRSRSPTRASSPP